MTVLQTIDLTPESILQPLVGFAVTYGLRLITAIVVLWVGLLIANRVTNALDNLLEKRQIDPSLRSFLRSFANIVLKILVVISILSLVGMPMTSFIAVLGAAGLAVGLALSGTLQNFAGGVLILILKPFKVGDFIEAQGFMGTVKSIQIFNTTLQTPDNVVISIPNGGLSTGSITNYSVNDTRRAQWVFGIAYGDNYQQARDLLKNILDNDSRVLKEPAPVIFLSELGDSSVDITVRAWAKSSEFWPLNFDIREKVYDTFNREGINIPFPQMDVHLHQKNKGSQITA